MNGKIRILLVDDQKLFVESLKRVLEGLSPEIEVTGIAYNGCEAIEKVHENPPDIILMDVRMPEMNGVEATEQLLAEFPEIKIIVLTTYDDDEYVHAALSHGAVGYLLKDLSPQNLVTSIKAVSEGSVLVSPDIASKLAFSASQTKPAGTREGTARPPEWVYTLSKREREVAKYIIEGLDNGEIADVMYISEQTVRNHVSVIYSKMGESNRYKLIEQLRPFVHKL